MDSDLNICMYVIYNRLHGRFNESYPFPLVTCQCLPTLLRSCIWNWKVDMYLHVLLRYCESFTRIPENVCLSSSDFTRRQFRILHVYLPAVGILSMPQLIPTDWIYNKCKAAGIPTPASWPARSVCNPGKVQSYNESRLPGQALWTGRR